jgi:hypothetical protein
MGYDAYGGTFLVPAIFALRSIGDTSLDARFDGKAFWRLLMAASSTTPDRIVLQSGVSHRIVGDEGWASLLLGTISGTNRQMYRHFYDRHSGVLNGAAAAGKFDQGRAGTTWALIHYPEAVASVDPTGVLATSVSDPERGAFYFRNRWQDENDVLVSMFSDTVHHGSAWDASEAFQLNLIARGTKFIGGPGKTTTPEVTSGLLVDGASHASTIDTGTTELWAPTASGGYVIVGGGSKYANLGITQARRHTLVDVSGGKALAVVSTLDRLQDESSHTYTWQANVGDEAGNDGITVTAGSESGRGTFVMTAPNGAHVKGWVLHPTDATVVAGDPVQASTTGANADLWVVLVAGDGTPPAGVVTGSGLDSVLTIGSLVVRYDAGTDRIVAE